MPRHFYFHLHEEHDVVDEEGSELPDAEMACVRAFHEARSLASESIRSTGHVNLNQSIVVTDEDGAELFAIQFREALKILG